VIRAIRSSRAPCNRRHHPLQGPAARSAGHSDAVGVALLALLWLILACSETARSETDLGGSARDAGSARGYQSSAGRGRSSRAHSGPGALAASSPAARPVRSYSCSKSVGDTYPRAGRRCRNRLARQRGTARCPLLRLPSSPTIEPDGSATERRLLNWHNVQGAHLVMLAWGSTLR